MGNAPDYSLVCTKCARRVDGATDAHTIHCATCGREAFLRTEYLAGQLVLDGPEEQFIS